MAMPVPHGLMTVEEYDALPEDNSARYELQEGVLIVSPRPLRKHQRAAIRFAAQIERQLPNDWEALVDFEVLVRGEDPATIRAPDLVVVPFDGPENRLPASEALLAVEVISPGSRKVDQYLKPVEYAEAGIPHYWLVDLDPPVPTITTFGLGAPGDGYVESQTATRELIVTEPFPLRIDIDALVGRR
jgi:Uma2 family endonuclease